MPTRLVTFGKCRCLGDAADDGTDATGQIVFSRLFCAGDHQTRAVLRELTDTLQGLGISAEDVSNAELVIAEALNNIAEHAYVEGSGAVEMIVACDDCGLSCEIADQGRPMPKGVVPMPELPLIEPPDHLPEGGFGWHIIRCLTTDLAYRRGNGRNTLSMRLPWSEIA